MNVIEKTRNEIKAYVRSLNTPENTVYQENELLILSCFSKAQEIFEKNEKLALTIPVVVGHSEQLPKSLSNKAYKCANKMTYEGFVEWWDLHS